MIERLNAGLDNKLTVISAPSGFGKTNTIHAPCTGLKLGHPNPGLKESWLRDIGASIQAGGQLDAGIAVVHVKGDTRHLDDRLFEEGIETTFEFIEELNQQAARLVIQLAIENLLVMPHQTKRFGWSLDEQDNAFLSQDIGFCLDIGHAISLLRLPSVHLMWMQPGGTPYER